MFRLTIPTIIYLALTSCSSVLSKTYGVKNVSTLNKDSISSIVKNDADLRQYKNGYIDQDYTNSVYKEFKGDSVLIHDLLQPMQAMYFDSSGNLISYHINCNAGGFPNLKWNRNNVFETFPPATQTKCYDKVKYAFIAGNIKGISNSESTNKNGIKIVVFWNYEIFKQSKNLNNLVLDNLKKSDDENVSIEFVNTDYLYK